MKPSATSPATSVISGPTPPRKMRGTPYGDRAGIEERRHQRVRVELAAEVELRAFVPATPRSRGSASTNSRMRAAGFDHCIEKRFSMCGLICVPSPRLKRPRDASCRSYACLRERHRVAGERDHDRGRELHALGVLGREQQREQRVVRALERVDAVVAGGFDGARRVGHLRAGRWSLMRRRPACGRPYDWAMGVRTRNLRRAHRRRLRRVVQARPTPSPRPRCSPSWRPAAGRSSSASGRSDRAAARGSSGVEVHGIDTSPAIVEQHTREAGRRRDPGHDRRHGRRARRRHVLARLRRVQHVLHADHAGRAEAVLPQRRRAPRAGRTVSPAHVRARHVAHRGAVRTSV